MRRTDPPNPRLRVLREQLSLFLPASISGQVEALRELLDPVQFSLIPAHVTLLRDEELRGLGQDDVKSALQGAAPLTLRFGSPETFGWHGVLLPCIAGVAHFINLRALLVGREAAAREQPHITLAHPRNPRASDTSHRSALSLIRGIEVTFTAVQRITQGVGCPWLVSRSYVLAGS